MKNPKISIVIPTYNHCDDLLKPCIESLIKNTDLENIEIIISANGCTDNTEEYVKSLGDPFKLIWSDEPLGYTKATNDGISVSNGEFIILLNNDVIFLDFLEKGKWIDILIDPFEDETVGLTGPLMGFSAEANSHFLIFFLVAIRKEVFNKIGLLDEIFTPGGGEDTDFCIKANRAGYKVIEVPKSERWESNGKIVIGGMPVYHIGEGTMHSEGVEWTKMAPEDNWTDIFNRNAKILKDRYSKIDVLVVIPTYNEIEFIKDIITWYKNNNIDLYVIDNYSTDGTWEYLQKAGIKSHQLDTGGEFNIIKMQENVTETIKKIKPYWAIYIGADSFIVHKEGKNLRDFILECDSKGYTSIKLPIFTFHNTGEIFKNNYYDTYNYINEESYYRVIFKYNEEFYINGDHIFMEDINIKETDEIVYLNYGFSRKIEHQNEKLERRKLAWENGLDKIVGSHFIDGDNKGWKWDASELDDIKNSKFAQHQKILINTFSQRFDVFSDKIFSDYDIMMYDELITNNNYQVSEAEMKDSIVFDIGANVGMFTALAATYNAKLIFSIEPVPDNLKMLNETKNRYSNDNIIINNNAISWRSGDVVNISGFEDGFKQRTDVNIKTDFAKTTTLKELLRNVPDDENNMILKVDCEGCEYPLFYGSDRNEIRRFKIIYTEFHGSILNEFCGNIKNLELFLIYICGFEKVNDQQMTGFMVNDKGEEYDHKLIDVKLFKFIRKD